jgi:signal transduction histidine kinase
MISASNIAIKHKLVYFVMLICLFVMLLASGAIFVFINYTYRSDMTQQMLADSSMIAENCNVALAFRNKDDIKRTLSSLKSKPSIVFAGVYDTQSELFESYSSKQAGRKISPPKLKEDGYYYEMGYLTVFQGIILDEERIGTIVICSDMQPFYSFIRKVLMATLYILIAGLFLAYVLSTRFQRIISAPILKLAQAARSISQSKDFSVRVERQSDDEIGQLIDSFNHMLERIKRRDDALLEANKSLRQEVQQRKHAEKVLLESEAKLQESNKELENFAYVSSHDLREPLRKITSFGKLLADSLQNKITEDERENLDFVLEGTELMRQMVEGLLLYSRIGTEKMVFSVVDLGKLVKEVINSKFAIEINNDQARIEVRKPMLMVNCEEEQIRQLFWHLLSNALKYKRVNVKPEIIISSVMTGDGEVRVEVQDNGIGIKPEHLKSIFGIFKRVHLRNEYKGVGIGLAVCNRIVRKHGGNLGVRSTYGQGSTFWFTLPAAYQKQEDVMVLSNKEETV